VGYANVHSSTAGERKLSNYEAEQYGMIGFLRWWVMLPWGKDIPSQEGRIQFWSDCATIVQLIEEGECRLEAQWRRTAASPGWSDIEMLLREWPKLEAKWIRGHADRQIRADTELTIIQKGNIAADALADLGRSATGTLRTDVLAHLYSGAILWTMEKVGRQQTCTVEGNLTKAWKQRAGMIHFDEYMTDKHRLRAGRLEVRHWEKAAFKDWQVVAFRSKLWNRRLMTTDVHQRNSAGKDGPDGLALCTLCNTQVIGDAWHTIGLCPHPELREARALATVALKAAIRGIKLPGLQRTAQESLRTAPDGAWIFTQLDLAPNPWFGELPEAWIVMAARELGLTEQGAERENQRGYNPPTRQMHAVDTQLRAVSKMAVMGARAIWWKAAQLWGEQAKGKGLAVRNAIKAANDFYYKFFADEIGVYKRQWAAIQENGGNRWSRARWQAQKWLEWGREQQFRQLTTSADGKRLRASTIMEAFGRQRVAQSGETAGFTVPPPPWLVKQALPGSANPSVPAAPDNTRPQASPETKTQSEISANHNSPPVPQRGRRRRRPRRRPGGVALVATGATSTGEAEVGLLESANRVSGPREFNNAERHSGSPSRKEDKNNAKGIG
jgi:hypothetical protein